MPFDLSILPLIGAIVLSIVIHEVSHGLMANWLGDPTARLAGRLTLNPIHHIDLFGSILLPGMILLSQMAVPIIGYAKPVPYNPYNLKNQRWGDALVAFAGPGVNLILAGVFAIVIHIAVAAGATHSFIGFALQVVDINLGLAFFNLIPIPPADGSKVIAPFLPLRTQMAFRNFGDRVGMFGLLFLFVFIYFFSTPFFAFIRFVSALITGIPY